MTMDDEQAERECREYVISAPHLFSSVLIEYARNPDHPMFWPAYTHEMRIMFETRRSVATGESLGPIPLKPPEPPDLVA